MQKNEIMINLQEMRTVEHLEDPDDYYNYLIDSIKQSKTKIVLSALYLGTGERSRRLIDHIDAELSDKKKPNLKVTIILDHSRAQRGNPNSIDMVKQLLINHSSRVKLFLFQLPRFRGFIDNFLSFQIKELLGVYHCKFCIFDNKVILTGANLSEEYFLYRKDRYLVFQHSTKEKNDFLLNYLTKFSDIIKDHCHLVLKTGELKNPIENVNTLKNSLLEIGKECMNLNKASTLFVPLLQLKQLGIKEEEDFFTDFSTLQKWVNQLNGANMVNENKFKQGFNIDFISLVSPYTSFQSSLVKLLQNQSDSGSLIRIIGPSNKTHGFYIKKPLEKQSLLDYYKGFIPLIHRFVLLDRISEKTQTEKKNFIQVYEYHRDNWTFHTKGCWFFSLNVNGQIQNDQIISYIGSSNFGERSWNRDFELGFMLFSRDKTVGEVIKKEYLSLNKHCQPINQSTLISNHKEELDNTVDVDFRIPCQIKPMAPPSRWWLPTVARIVRSLL